MNQVNKEIELKKSIKNKKLRKHSGSKVQNQPEKDWLRKFPWLDIWLKGDKKALFCTYCTKSGKTIWPEAERTSHQSNTGIPVLP